MKFQYHNQILLAFLLIVHFSVLNVISVPNIKDEYFIRHPFFRIIQIQRVKQILLLRQSHKL